MSVQFRQPVREQPDTGYWKCRRADSAAACFLRVGWDYWGAAGFWGGVGLLGRSLFLGGGVGLLGV